LAGSASLLADKISSKNATVCVIGLGYVGVPLVVASAQAGFKVLGVDVDQSKVEQVNRGSVLSKTSTAKSSCQI